MQNKWNYDKNNFILTKEDQNLLEQLTWACQTQIYKDFLFKDFLHKFRLFFNFKTETL